MERSLPPAPSVYLSICLVSPSICKDVHRAPTNMRPDKSVFRASISVQDSCYHPGAYNMYMLLYYTPSLTQGDSSGLTFSPICLIRGSWSQEDQKKKETKIWARTETKCDGMVRGPWEASKTKSGSPTTLDFFTFSHLLP
jgi:hypothetical protein